MSEVKEERAAKAARSVPADPRFSKEQFLQSIRFTHGEKDILTALLQGDQMYTHDEVHLIIKDFKSREVR